MPRRPIGLPGIEAPIFSRQSAHRWRWGCQPYEPAALYPHRQIPGTQFCQRLSRHQGHSAAERMSKNKTYFLITTKRIFFHSLLAIRNYFLLANLLIHEIHCSRSFSVVRCTSNDVALLYCTSVGQVLLSLLLLCTCRSGAINGLEWTSSLLRWYRILSCMASCT
jgi:hypothetical protein